jgi:hypothetical protein
LHLEKNPIFQKAEVGQCRTEPGVLNIRIRPALQEQQTIRPLSRLSDDRVGTLGELGAP